MKLLFLKKVNRECAFWHQGQGKENLAKNCNKNFWELKSISVQWFGAENLEIFCCPFLSPGITKLFVCPCRSGGTLSFTLVSLYVSACLSVHPKNCFHSSTLVCFNRMLWNFITYTQCLIQQNSNQIWILLASLLPF